MQSFLYLHESSNAHKLNNNYALALKGYMNVIKVIENFEDDQFDFHGYNLRKFTLNVYLKCVCFSFFSDFGWVWGG